MSIKEMPFHFDILMVQGVLGSFSEDAALKAYPNSETVPCDEFEDAFKVHCCTTVKKKQSICHHYMYNPHFYFNSYDFFALIQS